MTEIAKYFASLSFSVSNREIAKVDKHLNQIEKKLKKFGKLTDVALKFDMKNFKVDQRKLNTVLGDALDKASDSIVFQIARFNIDRAALTRALRTTSMTLPLRPTGTPAQRTAQQGMQTTQERVGRSRSSLSRSDYLHMGGAAGAFMRYGAASLPLIGGVYGAAALNTANQRLMSGNIAAESVLGEQAKPMMDWLSKRADYLGISYADTLPQFTKFMASSTPLMGAETSRDTFDAFMQFGRTRGADKVSMNRALTAIGQMSAKGQVMAEELKNQLGDASGFGEVPQLFAEAYQIKTGGNKTGAEARAALMKAMEQGLVKSADVLPIVTKLLNELSEGGIEKARKSSIAAQARAENAMIGRGGALQIFSEGGGERGFTRLFDSFATFIREGSPFVEGLARGFDELSKYVSFATLLPQSLKRAFEGRDSWLGDFLGEEAIEKIGKWIEDFKGLGRELKTLAGTVADGWGMLLPAIAEGFGRFVGILRYTLAAFNSAMSGDTTMANRNLQAVTASLSGKSQQEIEAILAGEPTTAAPLGQQDLLKQAVQAYRAYDNLPTGEGAIQKVAEFSARASGSAGKSKALNELAASYANNPNSIMYGDMAGARDFAMQQIQDAITNGMQQASVQNNYEITLQVDAAVLASMDVDKQGKALADSFRQALEQFPQKE